MILLPNFVNLLRRSYVYNKKILNLKSARYYASDWKDEELDLTLIEEVPKYSDVLTDEQKEEILRKRNKSRLNRGDRNILAGKQPYTKDLTWFHSTIKYKRRMIGRYGMNASNVPVGALWLTKEGIDDLVEYENTMHPHTLQECWAMIDAKKKADREAIITREAAVEEKLKHISRWEKELQVKMEKKIEAKRLAEQKKVKVIEEVRRQLGYEVDPHDERFKDAIEKIEKEDKKRKKALKKQEHTAKIMAQLLAQNQAVPTTTETTASESSASTPAAPVDTK